MLESFCCKQSELHLHLFQVEHSKDEEQFKLLIPDQESTSDSGIIFLSDPVYPENIDNDDYVHSTEPVEAIIAQFDGNDSLDSTEDTAIANASARNVRTRVAEFELNQAKQTAGICKDAQIQDFKLVHKDQDKNINIECSSGFYAQVAKPTLCSLSQDFIPPILGFSIFCANITKNTDARSYEYSLTMFFKITQDNGNSTKVTIHAHHSTRLVQVQGGSAMPDKSTTALCFVKNVLSCPFESWQKLRASVSPS